MRILSYLCGLFAFLIALLPVLNVAPVQAGSGCVGGNCGVTASIDPPSGPPGTQVTIKIQTGAYPLDGKYEIWWSKSATMTLLSAVDVSGGADPTAVKIAEGWNERQTMAFTASLSVPEACSGTNYLHYIKAGRTEQMMNFSFTVLPDLVIKEASVKPRSTATISGMGWPSVDKITMYLDGEPVSFSPETSSTGSFTASLPIPDLMAGTHVIKANAKKLFNQEAAVRFKISPYIKVEPEFSMVGKPVTVSGFGFAANNDVSIKYDNIVVASSPTSDNAGRFTYNFNVPESQAGRHKITATDRAGNTAVFEVPIENNPPSTPTPIYPSSDRFGVFGTQQVTFNWMPAKDDTGKVNYTVEVADNLNFFPLAAGMRRTGLSDTTVVIPMEPGTYYWRVQATDVSGNTSKWALSPYAFQVGMINMWVVIAIPLVLLIIFIFLLRAFIQRVREYYY